MKHGRDLPKKQVGLPAIRTIPALEAALAVPRCGVLAIRVDRRVSVLGASRNFTPFLGFGAGVTGSAAETPPLLAFLLDFEGLLFVAVT